MAGMGVEGGIYRPLSEAQVAAIHDAALTILENTGMAYEPGLDDTAEMLADAGATVDRDARRIRFPRDMVADTVATAPRRVVLCARNRDFDLDLTRHRVHMGTGGAAVRILDLDSGRARPSTLRDLYDLARLVDGLDNIHFFLRPCIPTDIPAEAYDVNCFFAMVKGTAKHIMMGVNDEAGLERVLEIASMVAGGREHLLARPFLSISACFAISPLKLSTHPTHIVLAAARQGLPVALSSAPMSGSTAPMTMAGTLAQLHAEELAGIALTQVAVPGAPVLYGGIPGRANLRTMDYLGGAVECGMMNAAIHQLAFHVGVPNYNSSGLTDAKLPDAQAGYEKAFTTMLASMGGSNFMHHAAGMLESMICVAFEQYLIDDEIIGSCSRLLEGITVDADHLALEVIDKVGPGGNFLIDDHTHHHMRSEYFDGIGVGDALNREQWEAAGAKDTWARTREMARKRLAAPAPGHLSAEVEAAVRGRFTILLQ